MKLLVSPEVRKFQYILMVKLFFSNNLFLGPMSCAYDGSTLDRHFYGDLAHLFARK